MKNSIISLACVVGMMAMTLSASAAPVTCKTIAEIKAQADKTEIEYTGTATTTFYNGQYSGLFIQDETGGIMLKGFTLNSKDKDFVTDSMKISNIKAKFNTSKSAQNITVDKANKESITIVEKNVAFVPETVSMAEFCKDAKAYENKAIIVTDAAITEVAVSKYSKKYYMIAGTDTVEFNTSNVSPKGPNGGDMAGCYTSYNNRFMLCSAELTRATSFAGFADCMSYHSKVTPKEGESYKIDDAVLVNYVSKQAGETVIFAQYANNQIVSGVTLRVEGTAEINAGDSIKGLEGVYVHATKDKTDTKKFKGSIFTQAAGKKVSIVNRGNELTPKANVNMGDLLTSKLAENYSAQIVASAYAGTLTKTGDKYSYTISYEQSAGATEGADKTETVTHTINVVGDNGLDLSIYLGDGTILSGVYDACVINAEPTLIVRNEKDVLKSHYEFRNIAELKKQGEPASESVVYELKNEVVVNYVNSQKQKGVSQTWAFVSDETGVLAIDLGTRDTKLSAKQKIKGLKGSYSDGYKFGKQMHAHTLQVADTVKIEATGSIEELTYEKTTLKEVLSDTLKYASRLVEITDIYAGKKEIKDDSGERTDYFIFEKDSITGDTIAIMRYDSLNISQPLFEKNIIRGCVNFNCLSGTYVIYATEVAEQKETADAVENTEIATAEIYSEGGRLCIEADAGYDIEVFNMNGQCLYRTRSTSEMTSIEGLRGMLIVRVGGSIYKAIVE